MFKIFLYMNALIWSVAGVVLLASGQSFFGGTFVFCVGLGLFKWYLK